MNFEVEGRDILSLHTSPLNLNSGIMTLCAHTRTHSGAGENRFSHKQGRPGHVFAAPALDAASPIAAHAHGFSS